MDVINAYFSDIIFTHVENKDNTAIYAVRILDSTHSSKGHKYVVLTVPYALGLPPSGDIYSLGTWLSVQTRYIPNYYRLKPQRFSLRNGLPNPRMRQVSRTPSGVIYRSDGFPIEIFLVNDPNKKDCTGKHCSVSQYYPNMNLTACISTYNCVISPISSLAPISDDYEIL